MKKKIIIILATIVCIIVIGCTVYLTTYYHSEDIAYEYLKSTEQVKISKIENGYFFDGSGKENALIFYPGAKVEENAYSELMYKLAENGIDCFLLELPCKIAFLGAKRAGKIINEYEYENFYLSGHSLGGVVASTYLENPKENIKGLILLASYPTKKIDDNVKQISIYGDNDGVLNIDSYNQSKDKWNVESKEFIIKGGNHAGFANYGEQKGDNESTITNEEQINQTVEIIIKNIVK